MAINNYSQKNIEDHLLVPLEWCGEKWKILLDVESDNTLYKAFQIALRIIPGAILTVATVFSFMIGSVGSVIKCYRPISRVENIDIEQPLIDKCIEVEINNPEIENTQITYNIIRKIPFGTCSSVFVRRLNHRFNNEEDLRTRLIDLQVSRATRPCFGNFFHYLKKSFSNDTHEVEINKIPDLILGVEMTDEKRSELMNTIRVFNEVHLLISEDLRHMELRVT